MPTTSIYEQVRDRDRGCVSCRRAGHEVHHIVPRSLFRRGDPNRDDERNLCLLCRPCHAEAHTLAARGRLLSELRDRYGFDYSVAPWKKYLEPGER